MHLCPFCNRRTINLLDDDDDDDDDDNNNISSSQPLGPINCTFVCCNWSKSTLHCCSNQQHCRDLVEKNTQNLELNVKDRHSSTWLTRFVATNEWSRWSSRQTETETGCVMSQKLTLQSTLSWVKTQGYLFWFSAGMCHISSLSDEGWDYSLIDNEAILKLCISRSLHVTHHSLLPATQTHIHWLLHKHDTSHYSHFIINIMSTVDPVVVVLFVYRVFQKSNTWVLILQ